MIHNHFKWNVIDDLKSFCSFLKFNHLQLAIANKNIFISKTIFPTWNLNNCHETLPQSVSRQTQKKRRTDDNESGTKLNICKRKTFKTKDNSDVRVTSSTANSKSNSFS